MIFFVFERRMKLEGREREGRLWSWVIFFVFNDGRWWVWVFGEK